MFIVQALCTSHPNNSSFIFQKIIEKEISAEIVFEDDFCLAFRDISPQAPTHVLLIPKKTITSLAAADPSDHTLMGHLLLKAAEVAQQEGLVENGYRVVINTGVDGGQWHCVVQDQTCTVAAGAHDQPACTIRMEAADFLSMIAGTLPAMQAYTSGKLKIEGDLMKSQLIEKLFEFKEL